MIYLALMARLCSNTFCSEEIEIATHIFSCRVIWVLHTFSQADMKCIHTRCFTCSWTY